jgi:hypothetical protein
MKHVDQRIKIYLHWPYQKYTIILILTSYHKSILKWKEIHKMQPIIMHERRLNFRLHPYDDRYPHNYQ